MSRPDGIRCQQLTAAGSALEEAGQELPSLDDGEVLVAIDHCGVCHSDLHLQDGYFDLGDGQKLDVSAQRTLPMTLGHEIAGRVAATGAGVDASLVGKAVAVYPWIGCGDCALCARGNENICNRPRALGINVDGGFATHVRVPDARYLLDLDGVESNAAGCLMCSGLTAFSALKKALPYLDRGPLAIVGLGGVGMMALRFARAMGVETIHVVDINGDARAKALEMGATEAFDPNETDTAKALKRSTGGGAGAGIDFVGSSSSLAFAQRVAAKAGAVIVVGLMGGKFSIPVPLLPFSALTIQGSYVGTLAEAGEMLELVKSGAVENIPIEERPLSEASAALDALREGRVVGRIVLRPE